MDREDGKHPRAGSTQARSLSTSEKSRCPGREVGTAGWKIWGESTVSGELWRVLEHGHNE